MKRGVAVVGSLNMDIVVSTPRLPKLGETISGNAVHYVPGGKGANQALGCSRLTAITKMIGCVGSDRFGEEIRKRLADSGVGLEAVETVAGQTTGTAHIFHVQGDNCIIVVPGANAHCTADYVRRHGTVIREAAVVLAQLEIPLEAVLEAFRMAKESGGLTILNPAPARQLPEELLRLTDYMTPNGTEWELISGKPAGTDEQIAESVAFWQAKHGVRILVTRGEKGCSYYDGGQWVNVPAPRVKVVDTTGAGDAFNAALAYGLSEGKPLGEIVRFAVKAASLSVQKFGAQDGMPALDEVLRS